MATTTSSKAPAKSASKIPVKAPVVRKSVGAKRPASPAAKVAAKVTAPSTAVTHKIPKAEKIDKTDKSKKLKLVRDSFTIPKAEYAVLEAMKARATKAGAPAKKSELLRAGIKALAGLSDTDFLAALGAVPAIKTGRPAKA
jgi:hypothetical protein